MTGASFNRGQSKQDYATPDDFMTAVVNRFGPIAYDLAASKENAKSSAFISKEQDSLSESWSHLAGNLWLNPPFNNIGPWAKKCSKDRGPFARILFLTPASIGSNWFAEHVYGHARVIALKGRLCFDGKNPFPKDCILSVYPYFETGFEVWDWKHDSRYDPIQTCGVKL